MRIRIIAGDGPIVPALCSYNLTAYYSQIYYGIIVASLPISGINISGEGVVGSTVIPEMQATVSMSTFAVQ